MQPAKDAPRPLVLLAADDRPGGWDVASVPSTDRRRSGCVARRVRSGCVRRAEPGGKGPLVLEARSEGPRLVCEVWGQPGTAAAEVEHALAAALDWVGVPDKPGALAAVANGHSVVRRLHRELGPPRLSRLPRAGEALARAVLAQLVQSVEAARSTAQVAARFGARAPGDLWCWPTARQIGATPGWALRRCGVSLRMAHALHAAAADDHRIALAARTGWAQLDRRLRALPGVGRWTAAETRAALGDPDAVPVGDYGLPALVGTALTGEQRPRSAWTDEEMLRLLDPFASQRGRVVRLLRRAVSRGLVPGPARRAPRAPVSAHRYW